MDGRQSAAFSRATPWPARAGSTPALETMTLSGVLDEILGVLDVLPVAGERDAFIGRNVHANHVFGGQVVGQAIAAGGHTVAADRRLHSLHAYFLAPGDWTQDIRLEVTHLRDGASFSSRRVTAIQSKGAILSMTASWHIDETGYQHQREMPAVEGPAHLQTDRQRFIELAKQRPEVASFAFRFEAFDSRQVEGILLTHGLTGGERREPLRHTWVRTSRHLTDDARVHEAVFGYLSDLDFMSTSMLPHGTSPADHQRIQGTSLDHSLWLHRPFRVDEWLLFRKESPKAVGARGFVRGDFFTEEGVMVASAAQECLIRPRQALG
jgi:acyl-CoA thioesterase-2